MRVICHICNLPVEGPGWEFCSGVHNMTTPTAPPRPIHREHATTTREKGRRYPRTEVCPVCFKPFTPKGIGRHVTACRWRETLTKELRGA